MTQSGNFGFALPLILSLSACSSGTPLGTICSTTKSEAVIEKNDAATMNVLLDQKAAPGGALVIEFRKQDIIKAPSHQKKCSFFLEPSDSNNEATIWTASHCLDLSIDSKYRLQFYIDKATGYLEVPVEFDQLKQIDALRKRIAEQAPEKQRLLLSALKPTEIDYSASKNATDICLNSFTTGYGWSKFHQPEQGKNQIACFLYHNLAIVTFKVSDAASLEQKQIVEQMLAKARRFDTSNIAHPNAILKRNDVERTMLNFRTEWLQTYKKYTTLRAQTGFAEFAKSLLSQCNQAPDAAACKDLASHREVLSSAGLAELVPLLSEAGMAEYEANYAAIIPKISALWKYYNNAVITVNGTAVQPYSQFNILTNFSWNGGQHFSYSTIPLMGFVGLNWGTVTDPYSNDVRARAGVATYHWLNDGSEMFIYGIIPKKQTQENLNLGYGQLTLTPGDSGTFVLADGLPMAVLATVDGEKTSGGSSVLPLPEISDDATLEPSSQDGAVTGASAEATGIAVTASAPQLNSTLRCAR